MTNYGDFTGESKTKHNLNWPYISDDSFRMIITEGSGSGKPNELLDLVKLKDDDDYDVIDKIFYMLRIRIKCP